MPQHHGASSLAKNQIVALKVHRLELVVEVRGRTELSFGTPSSTPRRNEEDIKTERAPPTPSISRRKARRDPGANHHLNPDHPQPTSTSCKQASRPDNPTRKRATPPVSVHVVFPWPSRAAFRWRDTKSPGISWKNALVAWLENAGTVRCVVLSCDDPVLAALAPTGGVLAFIELELGLGSGKWKAAERGGPWSGDCLYRRLRVSALLSG